MNLDQLRSRFGLTDAGLADLPSKGGRFNTTDICGDSISRKKKQSGNPRAGIYNDGDSGAIYATDGTYLGSISAEEGRKNTAINDAWTSMGTGLNGENLLPSALVKKATSLTLTTTLQRRFNMLMKVAVVLKKTPALMKQPLVLKCSKL